ncbi:MAG: hypothetical protein ACK5PS_16055, partial [Desulfopila sp.]
KDREHPSSGLSSKKCWLIHIYLAVFTLYFKLPPLTSDPEFLRNLFCEITEQTIDKGIAGIAGFFTSPSPLAQLSFAKAR